MDYYDERKTRRLQRRSLPELRADGLPNWFMRSSWFGSGLVFKGSVLEQLSVKASVSHIVEILRKHPLRDRADVLTGFAQIHFKHKKGQGIVCLGGLARGNV